MALCLQAQADRASVCGLDQDRPEQFVDLYAAITLAALVHCEVGGEGVAAEVEDPLEVAADEEAVGERAERPEGIA